MRYLALTGAVLFVAALVLGSLFIGASDISFTHFWDDPEARQIFLASRVPRTLALLLVGCAMGCAGLIMQLVTQNKFVEPGTSGATESAGLGILLITIWFPAAPVLVKMLGASFFALLGSLLLLYAIRRVSLRSVVVVPLLGIMIGAVIHSAATFLALQFDLLQTLIGWTGGGDFSSIIRGRYELLWLIGILVALACWSADRFTIVGMGREFSVNVGLNYRVTVMFGLIIVALISGIVVVVVGSLPFLGLIVPNIVSMTLGDNVRRNIPWICLLGGVVVLVCDMLGRVLIAPYEIPVSALFGVLGAVVFLSLLLSRRSHAY